MKETKLMTLGEYNANCSVMKLCEEEAELFRQKDCCFGYYIVKGELIIGDSKYSTGNCLWFTGGNGLPAKAMENTTLIYFETQKPLSGPVMELKVTSESEVAWNRPFVPGCCCSKYFISEAEYGARFQVGAYTKGVDTPWHTHSMAHTFYVLEGHLEFWVADEHYLLGPGEFMTVPKETLNKHQGIEGEEYVKYLFAADGKFDFLVDGKPFKRDFPSK